MGKIGIIGGSGLYRIEGFDVTERKTVDTPFGSPSDEFVIGELAGKKVVFLPRHEKGHSILPTELNYRANIFAFKVLGVDSILSVSAVGSLREEIKPQDAVIVDQFVDRTNQGRKTTFFGDGIVAHISFSDPVCPRLTKTIIDANKEIGITVHPKGTYINVEGPAFSTRAESNLFRSWGMDVIGMTNMPEARLSREAGICYSTIAFVTDYDCWRTGDSAEAVTLEMIIENLNKNVAVAKKMIVNTIQNLSEERSCGCKDALKDAMITSRDKVSPEMSEKLKPILDGNL